MPKKTSPPPPEPPWQVILADIRSQNRATVEASRAASSLELQEFREEATSNFGIVFGVLREHSSDLRAIKVDVAESRTDVAVLKTDLAAIKSDLRQVDGQVGHLSALEPRVAALERSGH
ncbi:MAG: hypothetical protein ABW221_22475 [Vicinamibacteria bacterium]